MVAGGGFNSYYNFKYIKLDKEKSQEKKKQFNAYKKHLTQFLKMGSILIWVQFHAYPKFKRIKKFMALVTLPNLKKIVFTFLGLFTTIIKFHDKKNRCHI